MSRPARRDREQGQALVVVLVFIVVFAIVVAALLSQTASSFRLNVATQDQSRNLYAADGGLTWGLKKVATASKHTTGAQCPSTLKGTGATAAVTIPGVTTVTVTCTQATGPGSNLFGGYSVVTGVGYASMHGKSTKTASTVIANDEGKQGCVSLSVDPINPGQPSDGKGSISCVTYPTATTNVQPSWTNVANTERPTAPVSKLTGVFGLTPLAVFVTGTHTGPKDVIWFYNGDTFKEVTTTTNTKTGATVVTNDNLTAVWASSKTSVWAAGSAGPNGVIFHCTSRCTSTKSAWTTQPLPTGTAALTALWGTGPTTVYAVGKATAGPGGSPTVLKYNSATSKWTKLGSLTGAMLNFTGVWATGADVWAAGSTGASGVVEFWNGSVWAKQTLPSGMPGPAGNPALTAIGGVTVAGTVHLWVTGKTYLAVCTANCTSSTATWAEVSTLPAGVGTLTGVAVGNATHVWVSGGAGGPAGKGQMYYCSASCTSATAAWTTEGLPSTPATPILNDVVAGPAPATGTWAGHAWAVGTKTGATGVVLVYTPVVPGTTALAKISGGPVFNAQGTNIVNTLEVQNNFTQELTSATNCKTYKKPSTLTVDSGYSVTCVTSVPTAIKNITMPFPGETKTGKGVATVNGSPPPDGNGGTGSEPAAMTKGSGCKLVVFTPGTYTGMINFASTTTYYFENGLYYFTGGFMPFTNGPGATDNLYVIGGQKSPGDKVTFATKSPCWNVIQSTYATKGSQGTGVEWVLGTKSWMDVHTVNLELFTREGGQSWEGAQGLSIREVPPDCTAATPGKGPSCLDTAQQAAKNKQGVGWIPSNPGGNPNQLFQVDAAEHLPQVFVHGGLYAPDNDIEEFTNEAGVVLGPIDCNSLELSFKSRSSPPLSIEAGTGTPSVALIATAKGHGHPFKEEAIYGQTSTSPTKPVRLLYWWVLPTSRK